MKDAKATEELKAKFAKMLENGTVERAAAQAPSAAAGVEFLHSLVTMAYGHQDDAEDEVSQ